MRIISRSRLCLISLTLAGLCLATAAQATKAVATQGRGPTYQVKSGDSLDRIAKKSATTVAELQRLNQLSSSALKPGQKLRLPVAAAKATGGKKAASGPLAGKPAVAKPAGPAAATHRVRKGESLYQIARRHKVTVADLQRWNHLAGTGLKPGQRLLLGAKPAAVPASTPPATRPQPAAESQIHLVAKGETLYQIARSNGVSVEDLIRLNQLPDHRLRPGQQLLLGEDSTRRPAELEQPAAALAAEETTADTPSATPEEGVGGDTAPLDPAPLAAAAPNPQRLAQTIERLRGLPYRFGGNGVRGIDCSGFVQKVFREFAIELPRSAREQYRLGVPVERNHLKQGDLVFFRTYAKYPSHVGIYLGDNKMVHASTRSRKVVVSDITQSYYTKRYIGAKRLVDGDAETFRIDEVKDMLQEETVEDDPPVGFTGRRAAPAARGVATPG